MSPEGKERTERTALRARSEWTKQLPYRYDKSKKRLSEEPEPFAPHLDHSSNTSSKRLNSISKHKWCSKKIAVSKLRTASAHAPCEQRAVERCRRQLPDALIDRGKRDYPSGMILTLYGLPTRVCSLLIDEDEEKNKTKGDVHRLIAPRDQKHQSNFAEFLNFKIIYRRYAGLFFCACVDTDDNELAYLEAIHLFVEILDAFFGNVCELDLVFNFWKVYAILDEVFLAGEIQETNKKLILTRLEHIFSLD